MFKKRRYSRRAWRPINPYSIRKSRRSTARRSLLLVDNDEQVRRAVCRILQNQWDVQTAGSAAEAVEILKTKTFDTVLADYEMPGEDGIWLLGEAKRISPHTRRVLFSGSTPEKLPASIESGVVDCFVPKPTTRDHLNSSISPPPVVS
jgi:DNA-binding NtrC family response regulator